MRIGRRGRRPQVAAESLRSSADPTGASHSPWPAFPSRSWPDRLRLQAARLARSGLERMQPFALVERMRPGAVPGAHMSPSAVLLEQQTGCCTVSVVRYAPGSSLALHRHDADGISVVLDGAVVEESGHRSAVAEAGWTALRPAGVRHANRFGPRGATVLAIVPGPGCDLRLPQWCWTDAPAAFRSGLRLLRRRADQGSGNGELMVELAESVPRKTHGVRRWPWLQQIHAMLWNVDAPSVRDLAGWLDLHPVYLARRYRAAYGVSLREHRRIAQVRAAIQLLVRSDCSITAIAHECGFADHSHMCRAFRRVTGWHPSVLRPGLPRRQLPRDQAPQIHPVWR